MKTFEEWKMEQPIYLDAKALFDERAAIQAQIEAYDEELRAARRAIRRDGGTDEEIRERLRALDDESIPYWDARQPWSDRLDDLSVSIEAIERILRKRYRTSLKLTYPSVLDR